LLATYKINDQWSISGGVANTLMAGINARNDNSTVSGDSDWHKAWLGTLTYTTPSSWGWAAGSSFYVGAIYGFDNDSYLQGVDSNIPSNEHDGYANNNQVNYYGGVTLNTPWKQLTTGVSFDYVHNLWGGLPIGHQVGSLDAMAIGLYGTYKATDKLSFNARGEYLYAQAQTDGNERASADGIELTGTIEYDLWANVVSRLEVRWDHLTSGYPYLDAVGGDGSAVGLYANIIYKF
jgi:hypothetical protein